MRAFGVELLEEGIEAGLLLEAVHAWRPGCFLLQGQMHALVTAVLLGVAGFDAFDCNAKPEPPDGQFRQVEQAVWAGEGNPVIGADGGGQAAFGKQLLEGGEGGFLAHRFQRFAEQQETRGMVGDRQGIAVAAVAELELALEVGAPQVVRRQALRQRRAGGAVARPAHALDQAVAVKHGMDGALGWNPHLTGEAADQQFADLAGAPMRLVALGRDDQALDLPRQLVGIAHRAPGAVTERVEPMFLVAIEYLVASLARDAELAAHIAHRLPVQQTGHET